MIAEDDNATRVTLADDLKAAGHDVTAVSDGTGAGAALEGESFDEIGLDIMERIRSIEGVVDTKTFPCTSF